MGLRPRTAEEERADMRALRRDLLCGGLLLCSIALIACALLWLALNP